MNPLVGWALVLQGLVPLAAIAAIPTGPRRSRAVWWGQVVAAGFMIVAVGLAGLWLALPWYFPWVMMMLLVGAASAGRSRIEGRWPASRAAWGLFALTVGLSAAFAGVTVTALRGWLPPPGDAVTVAFPLAGGPFLIAAGGSNALVNPHVATLAPRFRSHRGQSYGVDIVGIGTWGSRTRGLTSADPADYAIFGVPVLAPCAGTVVRAFDGAPDMPVPERSRNPLEGNHVILECDGAWIVLAHLRSGSVTAVEGRTVPVGLPVGDVGNSGQSDEPHLHIHAQTPGTEAEPLSGEPLPIRFDEGWPVRNQRVRGRASTSE
ncbi:MAG: peptidoglycan DD-metalloendopeptidase family protein [Longimicrobiales bacterium]